MDSKSILLGIIGAIVLVALLFGGWFLSTYNGLVTAQEGVDAGWADVESQYQRRADLIFNLVNTTKGFAAQEEKIFLEVTKYRRMRRSRLQKVWIRQRIRPYQGCLWFLRTIHN
jgi:LemA protein